MNTTKQATERPWISKDAVSTLTGRKSIMGNNDHYVGKILGNANAELIVKAVNNYELLLEACKETKEYFVNFDEIDSIKIAKLMLKITTAIAQAEKEN